MPVEEWKTRASNEFKELVDKHRPKEIERYEENGVVIRRFEPRTAAGFNMCRDIVW